MISLEKAKAALNGPIASVSTPFKSDGSIDYVGLRNIVDFIINSGSGTVLLTYGDSLYSSLTDKEIADITKAVIEQTAGRAMTVVAGSWWLGESLQFAEFAKNLGADMYMPLPPDWANSCSVFNLVEYYSKISEVIPVMMVTNIGKRAIPKEIIEILLKQKNNIVAIKDDKCGAYGKEIAQLVNGQWAFLSGGRKYNHYDIMNYEVDGYLSVYMRFKPEIAHKYWSAVKTSNFDTAEKIISKYDIPFMIDLPQKLNLNFDALIHGSMEIFGLCERWRRKPYSSADDIQINQIRIFFEELNIL